MKALVESGMTTNAANAALYRAIGTVTLTKRPTNTDFAIEVMKLGLSAADTITEVVKRMGGDPADRVTRTAASNAIHNAKERASKKRKRVRIKPPVAHVQLQPPGVQSVMSQDAAMLAKLESLILACGVFRAQAILDAIRNAHSDVTT